MSIKHVILDTDIGTDVDDLLALALILASPELRLVGVTTVYGDTLLRARIALKLIQLRGGEAIPVAAGGRRPLLEERPVSWAGHEGKGLLEPEDERLRPASEPAADFIVRTVMASEGEITLIAIGPLTNVAMAFLREPRVAGRLSALVLMGGVVAGLGAPHLPPAEHNFRSDPEAAHTVLTSGAPATVVPLDVTTQVCLRRHDVERIYAVGDPYHHAVAGQISLYPRFAQRGWTYLHDPLAVASVIEPSLVTLQWSRAGVETRDELTAGKLLVDGPVPGGPGMVRVAVEVDAPRAERFIVDRLAFHGSGSGP